MTEQPNRSTVEEHAGRQVHCQHCQMTFTIGQPQFNLDEHNRDDGIRRLPCPEPACDVTFMESNHGLGKIRVYVDEDHDKLIPSPAYPLKSRGAQNHA